MQQALVIAGIAAWAFRASPSFASWLRQTAPPVAEILDSADTMMGQVVESVFAGMVAPAPAAPLAPAGPLAEFPELVPPIAPAVEGPGIEEYF